MEPFLTSLLQTLLMYENVVIPALFFVTYMLSMKMFVLSAGRVDDVNLSHGTTPSLPLRSQPRTGAFRNRLVSSVFLKT